MTAHSIAEVEMSSIVSLGLNIASCSIKLRHSWKADMAD